MHALILLLALGTPPEPVPYYELELTCSDTGGGYYFTGDATKVVFVGGYRDRGGRVRWDYHEMPVIYGFTMLPTIPWKYQRWGLRFYYGEKR